MLYTHESLKLLPDWHREGGAIQPPLSRFEPLFKKLSQGRLLVLYGPPNAGKRTFGLYLADKWVESKGALQNLWYFDCSDGQTLAQQTQLSEKAFWEHNSQPTPTLHVFARCGHVLDQVGELLKPALTHRNLVNAYVLITVSCFPDDLQKYDLFRLAKEKQLSEWWVADVQLVREILILAKKDLGELDEMFSMGFSGPGGLTDLRLVRNYIDSPYQSVRQWLSSRGKLLESNPAAFYSGGPASDADIAADLDILRTQYGRSWIDENGVPQKPWKDLLFLQLGKTLSRKKIRMVVAYGHKGSGKTTLLKRMIHDLAKASVPAIDLLHETLTPQHASAILAQARSNPDKCVHVLTEIDNIDDFVVGQSLLAAINQLARAKSPLTI